MKNELLETLLCCTSYGLQCLIIEQLLTEREMLTKEAQANVQEIIRQIRRNGEFIADDATGNYPKIR